MPKLQSVDNWSDYSSLQYRANLKHGSLINIAKPNCDHYDIWLYEDMEDACLYLYVEKRKGGREILKRLALKITASGGYMTMASFDPMKHMTRHIFSKRVDSLGMTRAVAKCVTYIIDGIRAAGAGSTYQRKFPPSIKLHCLGKPETPDPTDELINRYEGTGIARRAKANVTLTPSARTIAKRGAIPGNQGNAIEKRTKSPWTRDDRRILRFCNKLINGVDK